jgi:hypothetical protein
MIPPRARSAGMGFLKAELGLGATFAQLALDSNNAAKTKRNTANARLAFDTATKLREKLLPTPTEAAEISVGFELLRTRLLKLGEML